MANETRIREINCVVRTKPQLRTPDDARRRWEEAADDRALEAQLSAARKELAQVRRRLACATLANAA